jgi:hypothetical protein
MTSRKRSSKKSRPHRQQSPSTALSAVLSSSRVKEAIEPIVRDLLTTGAQILEYDDPLEVELRSAGLRASVREFARPLPDGDRLLGPELVRAAEDAGGAGSLAVLRAIEASWPDPVASRARSCANRLERRGIPLPSWSDALRGIALERVAMVEDVHGDLALLVAVFSYRGEHRHSVAALVDHNGGGAITSAVVTEEEKLAGFLENAAPELAHRTLRPVEPALGAAILTRGLEIRRAADSHTGPISDGDVIQLVHLDLLEARLRSFPRPARDARPRPPSPRACDRLIAEFLGSAACDDLDVESQHVEFVVHQMVDFKVRYGDGDPLRWSPMVVTAFMEEWFPRKATADPESIDCLPGVVRRWVRWAGGGRGIASGLVEETIAAVDGSERLFVTACRDRSRFMPAKAVATAMREDGVDVTDPVAVDAWFQAYRGSSPTKRRAKLGQDLDLEGVYVQDARLIVAVVRPPSEVARDRHLLRV